MYRSRFYSVILSIILIPLSPAVPLARASFNQEAEEEVWRNIPSAPLQFAKTKNGSGYMLLNYSNKHVVRFRLGCVAASNGKLSVLERRAAVKTDLEPQREGAVTGLLMGFNFHVPARPEACAEGKVAVIEVNFKSGGVWRAAGESSR